jgi:hypothetical protein
MAKAKASPAPLQRAKSKTLDGRNPATGPSRVVSISHQEIQVRAYHKWEAMGKPTGKDLEIWLRAQHELMNAK